MPHKSNLTRKARKQDYFLRGEGDRTPPKVTKPAKTAASAPPKKYIPKATIRGPEGRIQPVARPVTAPYRKPPKPKATIVGREGRMQPSGPRPITPAEAKAAAARYRKTHGLSVSKAKGKALTAARAKAKPILALRAERDVATRTTRAARPVRERPTTSLRAPARRTTATRRGTDILSQGRRGFSSSVARRAGRTISRVARAVRERQKKEARRYRFHGV